MKTLLYKVGFGLFIILFTSKVFAQECEFYYPVNEGTRMTIKSYNEKDKLTGTVKQEIIEKQETAQGVAVTVASEIYDKKDELLNEMELTIRCEEGKFYFDMKNYFASLNMDNFEDMDVIMEGEDLQIPSDLKVGDELPDGNMSVKIENAGMTIMNMGVTIKNRNVVAKEEITTPAGIFNCYKLTSDVESKTMFAVQTKNIEWIAKDVGVVRSESYNSKDNLTGYSVLAELNR